MSDIIISIDNLSKRYGKFQAVKNLSLSIRRGEIFGLLGPNGAGKSTTILMLMGLTESSTGSIRIDQLNPQREPVAVKRIIGYMPDNVGFYDHLTALENLIFIAELNGLTKTEALRASLDMLEKVGLLAFKDNKVSTFSRGMRQRLGLAEVLVKRPEIIILDEPTLGLDPIAVQDFLLLIKDLKEKEKLTVLISSHHLNHIQQICDRVGLFAEGQLKACGTLQELKDGMPDSNQVAYHLMVNRSDENMLKSIAASLNKHLHDVDIRIQDRSLELKTVAISLSQLLSYLRDMDDNIVSLERKQHTIDDIYSYYLNQ